MHMNIDTCSDTCWHLNTYQYTYITLSIYIYIVCKLLHNIIYRMIQFTDTWHIEFVAKCQLNTFLKILVQQHLVKRTLIAIIYRVSCKTLHESSFYDY